LRPDVFRVLLARRFRAVLLGLAVLRARFRAALLGLDVLRARLRAALLCRGVCRGFGRYGPDLRAVLDSS